MLLSSSLSPLLSPAPSPEDAHDSGVVTASAHSPSLPSSPAHSTITAPTLLTLGSGSLASSLLRPQAFLSVWVQLIVTKTTLTLYNRDLPASLPHPPPHHRPHRRSSSASSDYATPLTSPTLDCPDDLSPSLQVGIRPPPVTRLKVEIEGTSLQLDRQEESADIVLKVAAVECSYAGREEDEREQWRPYLEGEQVFSSRGSVLPGELSTLVNQSTCPATSPLLHPLLTSPKHHSFIVVEARLPRKHGHRPPTVRLNVQPFEVVIWLPVMNSIKDIISTLTASPSDDALPTDKVSCG